MNTDNTCQNIEIYQTITKYIAREIEEDIVASSERRGIAKTVDNQDDYHYTTGGMVSDTTWSISLFDYITNFCVFTLKICQDTITINSRYLNAVLNNRRLETKFVFQDPQSLQKVIAKLKLVILEYERQIAHDNI